MTVADVPISAGITHRRGRRRAAVDDHRAHRRDLALRIRHDHPVGHDSGPLLILISLSFILFGNKPRPFAPIIAGAAFEVAGVVISWLTIATVSLSIVVALAVRLVLVRTSVGTQCARCRSGRPPPS